MAQRMARGNDFLGRRMPFGQSDLTIWRAGRTCPCCSERWWATLPFLEYSPRQRREAGLCDQRDIDPAQAKLGRGAPRTENPAPRWVVLGWATRRSACTSLTRHEG